MVNKYFNCNLKELLNTYRVEYAKELLHAGKLSLIHIYFAAEMASINVQQKDLYGQSSIEKEHIENNTAVRNMMAVSYTHLGLFYFAGFRFFYFTLCVFLCGEDGSLCPGLCSPAFLEASALVTSSSALLSATSLAALFCPMAD